MYRKSGASLFAVSPQLPEQSQELIEKHKLDFEILFDQNNAYANKLDLVHGFPDELKTIYGSFGIDLEQANGEPSWTLAMPTRIVIDTEHKIKSFDVNASYTQRPEPSDTLAVLTN